MLFLACKKEKHCESFDLNDTIHFAYNHIDTLVFENRHYERFFIYINSIETSEPYVFTCKELHGICACTDYIRANATDSENSNEYIFLEMEQSDVSDLQYFTYDLKGFVFEFDFINELPHIDEMENLQHYSAYTINDVAYKDVIEVRNMNYNNQNIYKAYFNQENGLIQFIEGNNNIWTLR